MRLGVLSDAHGNLTAFEACLANMGPVDALLFGGDVLGYYFDGPTVLRRLRALGAICIAGNHDLYFLAHQGRAIAHPIVVPPPQAYRLRYGPALELAGQQLSAEEIDWLAGLPCDRELDFEGTRVRLVHGSPWRPADEYVYPDFPAFERFDGLTAQLVVMGHTHRPFVREGGSTLLNPGSCGQPRDGDPRASYAIVELAHRRIECEIRRVAYDRGPLLAQSRALAPDSPLLTELLLRERPASR
jgi:putative phosphoesterase